MESGKARQQNSHKQPLTQDAFSPKATSEAQQINLSHLQQQELALSKKYAAKLKSYENRHLKKQAQTIGEIKEYTKPTSMALLKTSLEALSEVSKSSGGIFTGASEDSRLLLLSTLEDMSGEAEKLMSSMLAAIEKLEQANKSQVQETLSQESDSHKEIESKKESEAIRETEQLRTKLQQLETDNREKDRLIRELEKSRDKAEVTLEAYKAVNNPENLMKMFAPALEGVVTRAMSKAGGSIYAPSEGFNDQTNGEMKESTTSANPSRKPEEDCANLTKFFSPLATFLLVVLSEAAFIEPAAKRLNQITDGYEKLTGDSKVFLGLDKPKADNLMTSLVKYQEKVAELKIKLKPAEIAQLQTVFSGYINKLCRREIEAKTVLEHLQSAGNAKSNSPLLMAAPGNSFLSKVAPILTSLVTDSGINLDEPNPELDDKKTKEMYKMLYWMLGASAGNILPGPKSHTVSPILGTLMEFCRGQAKSQKEVSAAKQLKK
jgi:hypothetical protein